MQQALIYKAKSILTGRWVTGAYLQMPYMSLTIPVDCPDWKEIERDNLRHYIVGWTPIDPDLPNQIMIVEIDPFTLRLSDEMWDVPNWWDVEETN